MSEPYAEVVGDPVAHSRSPEIHNFWLATQGLAGDYRSTRVPAGGLGAYFRARRRDPYWRGCSVTAPLKREAAALLGDPTGICPWLGAVNCVFHSPLAPVPANTDIAGVAEALRGVAAEGGKVCLIGTGGAARAALCWLIGQRPGEINIVSRDRMRADALASLVAIAPGIGLKTSQYENAGAAMAGASLVIHATPMGMTGGPPLRREIGEALAAEASAGLTLFDMVYAPAETELLRIARARAAVCIDGIAMLIGQAAPAFELFFGAPAPRSHDCELRERLGR